MKEGKRMKDTQQIQLEEKMKLNLFMSIYNTEEIINLIKEYQSKFGCDCDMMHKFMMIREIQKETFDELNEGGKGDESTH